MIPRFYWPSRFKILTRIIPNKLSKSICTMSVLYQVRLHFVTNLGVHEGLIFTMTFASRQTLLSSQGSALINVYSLKNWHTITQTNLLIIVFFTLCNCSDGLKPYWEFAKVLTTCHYLIWALFVSRWLFYLKGPTIYHLVSVSGNTFLQFPYMCNEW